MSKKIKLPVEVADTIQFFLNQFSTALSLYPADSLWIKSIPVIISVFNELITFMDAGEVEKRLQYLEEMMQEMKIEVEEFKQRVASLDEHNQYVLRRHVKGYCMEALPETLEVHALAMIDFIMGEEHDFMEEICEIVSELNRTDLEVLERIYEVVMNKELVAKRGQEAREKVKNSTGTYKDRVYFLPKQTVLWQDFLHVKDGERVMDFCDLLNYRGKDVDGKDNMKYAMYCRSILKLQNLGVIDIDSMPLLGPTPVNNVCQFHLTVFGMKLMSYIDFRRN